MHDPAQMGKAFSQIFTTLFSLSNPSHFDSFLGCIQPCVSSINNHFLMAEYTEDEIKVAIFFMNPYGAPRPSGFSVYIY